METGTESHGTGRREAHKRATRLALLEAAARLFAEGGYAGTTVQQIAAAAGVTERTFFRYFGSKDELLAHRILATLPALRAAVVARPAEEPPLAAVHAVLRFGIGQAAADPDQASVLRLFDDGPPGRRLARTGANFLLRFEETLAEALQLRLQPDATGRPDLRCEVLAAAALAAVRRALIRHAGEERAAAATPVERLIDEAFAALERPS